MTEWLFDGVLGLLVLGLAFGALHGRNLYASVLLFIAFGLALALIWARLGAADLALAEAEHALAPCLSRCDLAAL